MQFILHLDQFGKLFEHLDRAPAKVGAGHRAPKDGDVLVNANTQVKRSKHTIIQQGLPG